MATFEECQWQIIDSNEKSHFPDTEAIWSFNRWTSIARVRSRSRFAASSLPRNILMSMPSTLLASLANTENCNNFSSKACDSCTFLHPGDAETYVRLSRYVLMQHFFSKGQTRPSAISNQSAALLVLSNLTLISDSRSSFRWIHVKRFGEATGSLESSPSFNWGNFVRVDAVKHNPEHRTGDKSSSRSWPFNGKSSTRLNNAFALWNKMHLWPWSLFLSAPTTKETSAQLGDYNKPAALNGIFGVFRYHGFDFFFFSTSHRLTHKVKLPTPSSMLAKISGRLNEWLVDAECFDWNMPSYIFDVAEQNS